MSSLSPPPRVGAATVHASSPAVSRKHGTLVVARHPGGELVADLPLVDSVDVVVNNHRFSID
jgi:hypothetical protein